MAIQPLQLPPIINLPQPDFSVLGSIGQDLYQAKVRSQAPGLVADAFGAQQPNQPLPQPTAQATGTPLSAIGTGSASPGIGSDYSADYSARAKAAESGGNPSARNPNSSASGTYQFTDGTWLQNFDKTFPQYAGLSPQQKLAYKTDASPQGQQVQNAVFHTFTSDNAKSLTAAGVPVNNATLYAAHFFGPGDAPRVLTANPSAPLASVVQPQTIAANPFLAGMTVGQAQQWLQSKMGGQAPQAGQPQATGGSQPQAAMPGLTPQMAQRIGAMLTNPYTAKLGEALLQKYAAPSYGFQTLPNGTVLRTDALHGTVAPIYQAQTPYGFQTLPDGTIVRTNAAEGTVAPIYQGAAKPIPVPLGGNLAVPDGKGGFKQAFTNDSGRLDTTTLDSLAHRYLETGDNQIITDVGNGTLGSANKAALLQRIEELRTAQGKSGADVVGAKGVSEAQVKALKDFGTGAQGNTVRSLNVAIDHLGTLKEYVEALSNGNYPLINSIRNAWQKETGQALPTNFEAVRPIVTGEIAKAVVGSNNAVSDRDELRDAVKTSSSPAQLVGAIGGYTSLMAGQMRGLRQQYIASTKKTEKDFDALLADRTKQALSGEGGGRKQLPKGITGAMVVNEAKQAWGNATPQQRAAMQAKAARYGIDLTMYGLK